MDRTGSPPHLWYLCLCYVAHVLNRTPDPALRYRQPYSVATGQIADISAITGFHWMDMCTTSLTPVNSHSPNQMKGKDTLLVFQILLAMQ